MTLHNNIDFSCKDSEDMTIKITKKSPALTAPLTIEDPSPRNPYEYSHGPFYWGRWKRGSRKRGTVVRRKKQAVYVIVDCLLSLPLLPASVISDTASQRQEQVNAGSAHANGLQQLIAYTCCAIGSANAQADRKASAYVTTSLLVSTSTSVVPWPHAARYLWDQTNDVARIRNNVKPELKLI